MVVAYVQDFLDRLSSRSHIAVGQERLRIMVVVGGTSRR